MKRASAKHILPRVVRTALRRALDDALDAKAIAYGLFLATADQPTLHDRSGLLERAVGKLTRALDEVVGTTTGRDGDEQFVLPFACA